MEETCQTANTLKRTWNGNSYQSKTEDIHWKLFEPKFSNKSALKSPDTEKYVLVFISIQHFSNQENISPLDFRYEEFIVHEG